ncbi:MAG: efflux RND transporter periplasmic adaptor subunit [Lentimicrobiaceae bacterium]|nr:efflux RND transporter periplasmic adaptor subunit [Lentimicrobiaceae bacterium]
MKKVLKIALLVIVLSVFIGTIWFLYNKSKAETVVFETATPFVTTIIKKTVATGSVVPRKEIIIKPKVSGIIDEIFIEAGEYVSTGDVIARIRIIPNMVNLNSAESRVTRAKIALENAKRSYDRQKQLFDQQVISKNEYEPYELDYLNAMEEVESAENNLQLIRDGQTRDSHKETNTLVRSTISGMVLDVPVEVGSSVIESNTFNDGTAIATVADMGEMIFKGNIDETEVGKISEGMKLILTIGAIDQQSFDAVLEHVSPKGVEENGAIQFEIRAAVKLSDSAFIRAGYSANADIVLDRKDSVLAIQESLLQFDKDTAFVEVETGPQKFERRNVRTGLSDGINIEILGGLTKDDKIKIGNGTPANSPS